MQLASGFVLGGGQQDGSVGRNRRAAAVGGGGLPGGQRHSSRPLCSLYHHQHQYVAPSSILSAFLAGGRRGATRSAGASTVAHAAAVATSTAASLQQQQQQHQHQPGPDLGYPRTLLQDYVLLQTIGKGGNGVVVLAQRRDEDGSAAATKWAVKSIPKVLKDGSELKRANHLAAVQREIGVLRQLRGSLNIISLEAVYEDDTHVHLVMEHCGGGELTAALSQRHHSERAVASYMRAVLRTLAQCHAHHILHRDIKPGNFMLLSEEERAPIRAIDFGLATPYDPDQLPCTNLGLEGTPWFMAPEVLSSKVLPASDLWSAGVMCFQLLTGRMPFDDRLNPTNPSINAIWRSILFDEVDFTKPWWRDISAEARDFVRSLLQRDPAARPTAKEALRHPWLAGDSSDRSAGRRLQRSVVARIQRFAGSSVFKRSVLQMMALELLRQTDAADAVCLYEGGAGVEREREGEGEGALCAAVPASLGQLCGALSFDPVTDDVSTHEVAAALPRLGFRLTPSEADRLMEQLDPARTGRVSRAALAASQMDWRQLQRLDRRRWVALARRVFSALDADADGVLLPGEAARHVLRALPGEDAELGELVARAVREAAEADAAARAAGEEGEREDAAEEDDEGDGDGATCLTVDARQALRHWDDGYEGSGVDGGRRQLVTGAPPGHHHDEGSMRGVGVGSAVAWGGEGAARERDGISFEGFLRLLKANSVDSLDMYDDRAAGGASVHSVERLNAALQRSGSVSTSLASGSRHGTRHGASLASFENASWLAAGGSSQHGNGNGSRNGKESLWRFEVGGPTAAAAAPQASPAKPKDKGPAPMVWRFDVPGSEAAEPQPAPAMVWRFDVGTGQQKQEGSGSGAAVGVGGGSAVLERSGAAAAAVVGSAAPAVGAGFWRFDVGERSGGLSGGAESAAAAAVSGVGERGDAHESESEGGAEAFALVTAASGGGGGGRGPLGGWFDARQHGSKLYAVALGRRGGPLPPVNE